MIDDILCFPNNIVDVIASRTKMKLDEIDASGETVVKKYPVTTMDGDQTIAVVPISWSPKDTPEIGRKSNQFEQSVQIYTVMVQCLINDADEGRAMRRHSILSSLVRRMLYRDAVLLSALTQLEVIDGGVKEKTLQYGVRSQNFLANKVKDSSFQYLSVIEFWLETQTT